MGALKKSIRQQIYDMERAKARKESKFWRQQWQTEWQCLLLRSAISKARKAINETSKNIG